MRCNKDELPRYKTTSGNLYKCTAAAIVMLLPHHRILKESLKYCRVRFCLVFEHLPSICEIEPSPPVPLLGKGVLIGQIRCCFVLYRLTI